MALAMDERKRRQRARNWALLAALAAFVVLIYAITVVKIGMQP
jgi:hypothetical protein